MSKFFDKVADALVPKEIAGILGPASMMFAPQLGLPLALFLGQLGSAKMHSGKLDPFTALGTVGSYYAGGGQDIRASGKNLTQRLGSGFKSLGDADSNRFEAFKKGFGEGSGPVYAVDTGYEADLDRLLGSDYRSDAAENFDNYNKAVADAKTKLDNQLANEDITKSQYNEFLKEEIETAKTEFGPDKRSPFVKAGDMFKSASKTVFPGFTSVDSKTGSTFFDLGKSLTTIGAVTSLSQMTNAAEALKKQRIKDEKEEGRIWREWFTKYENLSGGVPYPKDNPSVADPYLIEKYNKYMLANGGRVGYNEGGGIMDVAPGIPKGMELDYRDSGGFIPMGSKEKKDDVPAVLAKNEFVLTSDAMKGLDKMMGGTGDPRAAAKYMYNMMDQLEAMA